MRASSLPLMCSALLLSACLAQALQAVSAATRPFTVLDSIEMTRIVDPELPELSWLPLKRPKFKRSPDGSKFVAVLRKGNPQTGDNDYSLIAFDTQEVVADVNATRRSLPKPVVLAEFSTESSDDAIDQVQWLPDGRGIAFVGRENHKPAQVYLLDLPSRRLSQLTHERGDVIRFALTPDRNVVMYAARVIPDISAKRRYGYTLTSEPVWALSAGSGEEVYPPYYGYFVLRMDVGIRKALDLKPTWFPQQISMSPAGDRAIVAHPLSVIPESWNEYEFIRLRMERERNALKCSLRNEAIHRASDETNSLFGATLGDVGMLYQVDLADGLVRPLIAAPVIVPAADPDAKSGGWDRGSIEWSPDGTRVLLPPNLLPIEVESREERSARKKRLALYTVDLESRAISIVADLSKYVSTDNWQMMPLIPFAMETSGEWRGNDTIDLYVSAVDGGPGTRTSYRRRGGEWHSEPFQSHGGAMDERVQLDVKQDLNTPPDIFATDSATGITARITDLNPQLSRLSHIQVKRFEFTDRLGVSQAAGLFLPAEFVSGKRYPLVIQLGGFSANEFQVDGPGSVTTALAARPLAGAGILVLQVSGLFRGSSPHSGCDNQSKDTGGVITETQQVVAALEGAIDALNVAGMIDPNRVGLLGFSRTGMYVQTFVTFSTYPIAAATAADSVAMTPTNYAWMYGFPFPGMLGYEAQEAMGAPFWGAGIDLWKERSYLFHLDKIRTPIRYEFNWTLMPGMWDAYAILKRMQRPVELIHFPLNEHVLQTPGTRYTSQQGNVDWFSFWLKGEERAPNAMDERGPQAGLKEQYRRWRILREQHEALISESTSHALEKPARALSSAQVSPR